MTSSLGKDESSVKLITNPDNDCLKDRHVG
jgi:hypothetical protein